MNIGGVRLANPVISAPMAGVTDQAFRTLAREAGCGLVCTEMVSDQALIYGNSKTYTILGTGDEPGPLAVQIFGSNPEYMARAAALVEERGASIIDINMGCPTPKIVRGGEGSALMKNPGLAGQIVMSVAGAVSVPVTVKIRKGWDEQSVNAVELSQILEDAGASAITVHGRTREQFYSGRADWDIIRRVRGAVQIPVIGNGDIRGGPDALAMIEQTGCRGVMIGRAAMGNPWVFAEVAHFLSTGEILPPPGAGERVTIALEHLDLLVRYKGEYIGVREMRKHAAWYLKGMPGAARLREQAYRVDSEKDMREMFYLLLAGGS